MDEKNRATANRPAPESTTPADTAERSSDEPPLDGVEAAAEHLLAHNLPPLFPVDTIRALWRHGDRGLAVALARIRGVA
jgi:hypothetical protein